MKSTILLCAFCLIMFNSRGQEVAYARYDFSSTPVNSHIISFNYNKEAKALPGYRLRNVGATLTIGGLSLITGGVIVMNSGGPRSTHPNVTGDDDTAWREALGSTMIYSGVGMTIPGVILWRKGAKKYKRSLEREGLSMKTTGTTLALSYSF